MSERHLVICSVIEGSFNNQHKKTLEKGIQHLYAQHLGKQVKGTVLWMDIPAGQAYQHGRASSASTILASMPNQLPSTVRSDFLYAVRDLWLGVTHCHANQLVISAADKDFAQQFLKESRLRVAKSRRMGVMMKMISGILLAKLFRGRLQTHINL
jgi:hypothetical protein